MHCWALFLFSVGLLTEALPPGEVFSYKRSLLLPSQDAFYAGPSNLSYYAPGSIIRSRPVPNKIAFFGDFPVNLAESWQILYRTNNALGEPLATVSTVLVPHDADFSSLLSYQAEIDSPWDGCFTSLALQQSANIGGVSSQYSMLWYISMLDRGWVVALHDYEGPNGALAAGLEAGQAVLDGIRAVLQSESITGVLSTAITVIWGYSGGAIATEWALELQPNYAPELSIAGGAIGGVAADLISSLKYANKGVLAGFIPAALIGISNAYPDFRTYLMSQLVPSTSQQFLDAGTQCLPQSAVEFIGQDIFGYFESGQGFMDNPIINATVGGTLYMGQRSTPIIPMYIYHGMNDEALPYGDVVALYDKYCQDGARIYFSQEAFGEHFLVGGTGGPAALGWLEDRMNGVPVAAGCAAKEVFSSVLTPAALDILGEVLYNDLLALLGSALGQ